MTNFDKKLKEKLKQNMEFWDEEIDDINRNEIIDRAYKVDKDLIRILIDDKEIRETFFDKIKEYWVFNVNKFVDYIENIKVLSNSYTKFKNIVGLNVNGKYLNERGEVSLVWPFKDCVLEGGMTKEDQKRNEIFFNEILAKDEIDRLFDAKVLTNFKKYTAKGEEKVKDFNRDEKGTIKDNLIIKGNNLLALHSLKKEFAGKVKLIYIDPPYNPESAANTFAYNNNFNHSTWLTFMKNRLEVARDLMKDDGFLCTAIDHYELFYLGALGDEVFGRENRIGVIAVETNPGGRSDSEFFATSHEYFVIYAKDWQKTKINDIKLSDEEIKKYNLEDNKSKYKLVPLRRTGSNSTPDKRPNLCFPIYYNAEEKNISLDKKRGYIEIMPVGSDDIMRVWRWSKKKILSDIGDIEVKKTNGNYAVYVKDREKFGKKPKTLWYGSKYDASSHGTKLLQKFKLPDKFSYPKSLFLMKDILQILTDKNSIILDYHAGSGTTAHATIGLNKDDGGNRRFILVEQMDYIRSVTSKRVQKVIEKDVPNNSFTYCELLKYNEDAIDKIQDAKDTKSLLKIWEEMCEHYFLNYDVEIKKFNDNKKDFEKMTLKQQKDVLVEMLNKNQLYVNLSEIEDSQFKVSKEDKELNKKFYGGK